jgi:hypothetical protein
MSSGQMSPWANVVWANVSGQMLWVLYVLINHINHFILLLLYNVLAIGNKTPRFKNVSGQMSLGKCHGTMSAIVRSSGGNGVGMVNDFRGGQRVGKFGNDNGQIAIYCMDTLFDHSQRTLVQQGQIVVSESTAFNGNGQRGGQVTVCLSMTACYGMFAAVGPRKSWTQEWTDQNHCRQSKSKIYISLGGPQR